MIITDAVVLGLLSAAVLVSIIELGISAYLASLTYTYHGYYYDYSFHAPGQFSYLVFDSIWSLLVSVFLIVVGFFLPKRFHNVSDKLLGGVTLVLTVLTMLHWLAGFAALSAYYGGFAPTGILGALLAFAVIPWLIYLALTVLTFLTAFGKLTSERRGRSRIFGHGSSGHQPGPTHMTPMQQQPPQQPQFQQQPQYPQYPQQPQQPQYQPQDVAYVKPEQTVHRVDGV